MFDPTTYASRALTIAAELDGDDKLVPLRKTLAIIGTDVVGENTQPDRIEKQKAALDEDGQPVHNTIFRPDHLDDTHFMRFVIVDDTHPDGTYKFPDNRLPPMLVWECNHDGPPRDYLRKAARKANQGTHHLDFDAVFGACKAYPGVKHEERWVDWMLDHSIRAEAFYSGYRGVPKVNVDAAGRVHEALRRYLDSDRKRFAAMSEAELRKDLLAYVGRTPPPAPMRPGDLAPTPARGFGFWLRKWSTLVLIGVAAILLLLPLFPITLWWYLTLRKHEKRDKPEEHNRAVHGMPDLVAAEDRIVQNQLTHLVDLKPGFFRYFTQRVVLFAIDQLARVWYVKGELGGIASIHFARWVILHDPREEPAVKRHRLLFFSNYDFSWDSYLGEFVDRASGGLTAVWSNTEGYPRTKNLVDAGADDEETFKQWARNRQIASQVWWSGVRRSSVENVNDDIAVHRGAVGELDSQEVSTWLQRI